MTSMPETGGQGAATFTDRPTARLLSAQEDEAWPNPALNLSYGITAFPDNARSYAMKRAR